MVRNLAIPLMHWHDSSQIVPSRCPFAPCLREAFALLLPNTLSQPSFRNAVSWNPGIGCIDKRLITEYTFLISEN